VEGGREDEFGVRLHLVGEEGSDLAVWADYSEGIGGGFNTTVLAQGNTNSLQHVRSLTVDMMITMFSRACLAMGHTLSIL
jgi:hypothetical protein